MTFPVVAATNTSTVTPAGTSHAVSLPASIASGDLLFVLFTIDATGGTISTPSGWTLLDSFANWYAVFYKIASGSEGATVTVTTGSSNKSAHNSYRITGHDAGTAPAAGSAASGTSANPDPPSLNPAGWGTEDTLWIAFEVNDTARTTSTAPASYGGLISAIVSGSNNIGSASRQLNAASEDPGTFALSGSAGWFTNTLAIRTQQIQPITGVGAIASAEAFGLVVVTPGPVAITGVGGISSAEAFGLMAVTFGFPQSLAGVGAIASAEAFGLILVLIINKGLAASGSSLIHQALSGNAAVNSAAASDAEPGDATGGSS